MRPALTLGDVFGPDHVYVPRAHDDAAEWLPRNPYYLDALTGGQLAIAGDMTVVCSEGSVTAAAEDLIGLAGLRLAKQRITFHAGGLAAAIEEALTPAAKLVFQHVFPEDSPSYERCWIPPQLLRDLNNKANLASFAPPASVPVRQVEDRSAFFDQDRPRLPTVVKVVTGQSSAGGCGVRICRDLGQLALAREHFGRCGQIVVEELLEVARSPCLNFAAMPDGGVICLGHADQDVAADGGFRGNWLTLGEALPGRIVAPALEAVKRAAQLGYRGFAGVDLVITPDQRVYVVDLNFRINASTPMILFADALHRRWGEGVAHFRAYQAAGSAADFARTVTPLAKAGRVVPLALFDPVAAGHRDGAAFAQMIVVGASREELLATERELAQTGIA